MKLLVIAANGRTGKQVVARALERGHEVTSFVRNYDGNDQLLNRTTIIQGDATNYNDILNATNNIDAAISTIGHVRGSTVDVQSQMTKNIIAASEVHPFIFASLTGTGVRTDGDIIPFIDRVLNWSIMIIDPKRVRDGIDHYTLLKNSDLDWRIVRVLKLTNNTSTKSLPLSAHGPAKTFVSRSQAADALVTAITTNSWSRQLPVISR